jgi:putative cardiolipin synthase
MNIGALKYPAFKTILLAHLLLVLSACSSTPTVDPLNSALQLLDVNAINSGDQGFISQLYDSRTWVHYRELAEDPIELGTRVEIPIQHASVKLLGPSKDDALRSLALKIWMIENAHHTIDAVYYIFSSDMVGLAVLGALCNAVQRGVDVRVLVDSIGSFSLQPIHLNALESCAQEAGYMTNADGSLTAIKARVQVVKFNALTNPVGRVNRRSHDKMLVTDGAFPDKAMVLTGGRNISTAYYGINENGTEDPDAYRDLEILLRNGKNTGLGEPTVGNLSEVYFSLLFLHKGNKRLRVIHPDNRKVGDTFHSDLYLKYRTKAQQQLLRLKSYPLLEKYSAEMLDYTRTGFKGSEVRLAHELANLTDRKVTTRAVQNRDGNLNSIMNIIYDPESITIDDTTLRIVSPYMFMSSYYDEDGNIVEDSVASIHQWLAENPKNKFEIITNSVMTSDNVLAQSVIDMEVGPRLLLTPELEQAWLSKLDSGELNPQLVESEEWKKLVNHPQIFIYQTGKLDAAMFGHGDKHYGKLHAKFILGDEIGFVGTSNFDYRSLLYNNEMGFFYKNEQVQENLNAIFDWLRESSYRWGSPEWLQMRKAVMEKGGIKAWGTKKQRTIFKLLKKTGLIWLI